VGFGIKFRVWGDYACFTRPEMKTERVSYDVITPSAARGIIECVYWKPAIKWVIDKITVLSPIRFGNIKLNEVKKKASPPKSDLSKMKDDDYFLYIKDNDNRAQRGMMYLKNPHYLIEAHFEPSGIGEDTNDCKKHYNIALRRLREGQCYRQPCMGLRDFSAHIKLVEENEVFFSPLKGEVDLGYMLYDMKFKNKDIKIDADRTNCDGYWAELKKSFLNDADAVFYRPVMIDGVIDVAQCLKREAHQ
jgi:CRISPR-associated protein Cas5d